MNYTKKQRDLVIATLSNLVDEYRKRVISHQERIVINEIVPFLIEVCNDCNELETKLEQAAAVSEYQTSLVASLLKARDQSLMEGPRETDAYD